MLRSARLACAALLAIPAIAFAQVDDIAVPPATCVKPAVPAPGTALKKPAAEKLNADSKAYAACADTYLNARRATTAKYQAIANAHADAGNAFARDFNSFASALDAFSKAQAAKAAQNKDD